MSDGSIRSLYSKSAFNLISFESSVNAFVKFSIVMPTVVTKACSRFYAARFGSSFNDLILKSGLLVCLAFGSVDSDWSNAYNLRSKICVE